MKAWALVAVGIMACARGERPASTTASGWGVDSVPILSIGGNETDSVRFSQLVGATRLPSGGILTGDVADFALAEYSPSGELVRRFGRKGTGPGEIGYLARLHRCGDTLVTQDINPGRMSVFTLDGSFVRSFWFAPEQSARSPYASACNAAGTFIHYAWDRTIKEGVYRASVPFWLCPSDTGTIASLGSHPGSERLGIPIKGGFTGRPLPLGKQPVIAIDGSRAYVGTSDRFEVMVFDFAGRVIDTLRKDVPVVKTTDADIEAYKAAARAAAGPRWSPVHEQSLALPYPSTLPAYVSLLVDTEGALWLKAFGQGKAPSVTWTVFERDGAVPREIALPSALEVFEIGSDYVLGRYTDPDVGIPHLRAYRLRRGPTVPAG